MDHRSATADDEGFVAPEEIDDHFGEGLGPVGADGVAGIIDEHEVTIGHQLLARLGSRVSKSASRAGPRTRKTSAQAAGASAASKLRGAAMNAPAAEDTLGNAVENGGIEMVPGSIRMTAEVMQDRGVLQLQHGRERANPDLGNAVLARNAQNNAARINSLEGSAPADARPQSVGELFRQQLQSIEADHSAAIDQAQEASQSAVGAIQPIMGRRQRGQAIRAAVGAERAPMATALDAGQITAKQGLGDSTGAIGGADPLASPATYGAAMREPIVEANQAAKRRVSALYDAVDPTGTMGVRAAPAQQAVDQAMSGVTTAGGSRLGSDEANFVGQIRQWPSLVPFDTLREMNSNIFGRMSELKRTVGTENPEYRRLTIMKGGLEDALSNAADDVAQGEQAGMIHQGMMPVADRVASAWAPGVGSNVYTPAGRQVGVGYELADLAGSDAPIVSHDIEMQPNPAYPQELQPRDRTRVASGVQIRQMARELQPERLGASVDPQPPKPIDDPPPAPVGSADYQL